MSARRIAAVCLAAAGIAASAASPGELGLTSAQIKASGEQPGDTSNGHTGIHRAGTRQRFDRLYTEGLAPT
jgi:hypothetical protein